MWAMEPGEVLVKSCPLPLPADLLARVTEA
jgi:hypothetical protein